MIMFLDIATPSNMPQDGDIVHDSGFQSKPVVSTALAEARCKLRPRHTPECPAPLSGMEP